MLIINLAISDFLIFLTQGPAMAINAFNSRFWMFGVSFCRLYAFLGAVFGTFFKYHSILSLSERNQEFVRYVFFSKTSKTFFMTSCGDIPSVISTLKVFFSSAQGFSYNSRIRVRNVRIFSASSPSPCLALHLFS